MQLNNLKYKIGSRGHREKIAGRGKGSNSTRGFKGNKGQGQRKTVNVRPGFEGGQTPLYMRTAKIGFNNKAFQQQYNTVSIAQILTSGLTQINNKTLSEKRIVRNTKLPLKVIGSDVELKVKLTVTCTKITKGAKAAIEKAGGSVEVLLGKQIPIKGQKQVKAKK
ncbi:MAG: 50S ribosomal protein L15 [Mycoplasmoidaceae bacterium]|nr:MAG: 50S ribosomal protein L15 [Mycoplasmoidaceae bacterium]